MSSEKPRILQGSRDIILSLLALGAVIALMIWPTGLCSFNPGAPESGPVREADVDGFLRMESSRVPFDVRDIEVPEGWIPNSTRATVVDGHQSNVIGFVTDNDTYVHLLQTDAPLDAIPDDGEPRTEVDSVDIDGLTWEVFEGVDSGVRNAWTADGGDVRFELMGSAGEDDYRKLAAAVAEAPVYEVEAN